MVGFLCSRGVGLFWLQQNKTVILSMPSYKKNMLPPLKRNAQRSTGRSGGAVTIGTQPMITALIILHNGNIIDNLLIFNRLSIKNNGKASRAFVRLCLPFVLFLTRSDIMLTIKKARCANIELKRQSDATRNLLSSLILRDSMGFVNDSHLGALG